ncbi:MAG: hypothetical protein K2N64_06360 [Anaeroplasmataceae bacterium]|nr:hypothetical protein [Anaeroplasmataceae bacterium]
MAIFLRTNILLFWVISYISSILYLLLFHLSLFVNKVFIFSIVI